LKLTKEIETADAETTKILFGAFDKNIKKICKNFNIDISQRDGGYFLSGLSDDVSGAFGVIDALKKIIADDVKIDAGLVDYCIDLSLSGRIDDIEQILSDTVATSYKGASVKCRTLNQKKYVQAMKDNTVVIGIGPAGSGKTFLAVCRAVNAYKNKEAEKIILTRPAIEAGEKLGFLPGDLSEKVDPYLKPLFDALEFLLGAESYQKMRERGIIEVAPLAYMRGRTLNNAFIILDEAQNTTEEQMKMFLTRIGQGSRMVITGDITQIDLPNKNCGLVEVSRILKDIPDISIIYLTEKDVVRHPVVQAIVRAYESNTK
jgi:phosphate starvation-inducible PhoH-like protein